MAELIGNLPAVAPFSISEKATLSQRWKKWIKSFGFYLIASGIKDKKQQRALLLHLAGQDVQDIFETLTDTGEDYETALAKLNEYFEPQKNISFERHTFRQAQQQRDEPIADYITRLKHLALTCEFENTDDMIRDQVVDKCYSTKLRRRLLQEPSLTLDKVVTLGRALEMAQRQATAIESTCTSASAGREQLNAVRKRQNPQGLRRNIQQTHRYRDSGETGGKPCYCCGKSGHRAKSPSCPALNKTCNTCQKIDHFSRVCHSASKKKTATVKEIRESDDSDDGIVFVVGKYKSYQNVNVDIAGISVNMMIDSGASVNVIDANTFQHLAKHGITLKKSDIRLFTYGASSPLKVKGTFSAKLKANNQEILAKFVVVQEKHAGSLLSRDTAIDLGLLHIGPININSVSSEKSTQSIVNKYGEIFNGVGKLKEFEMEIHIDPGVKPVAQPPRRIPFQIRSKVDDKIRELEHVDIIERVDGPTPWVSPLVAVPKPNGEVRVCVDMRQANQAILRERHPIPTVEETLQELHGAAVFSKLDLKWGYHQIELDPDSRGITTFATHQGLWRYKRLMFGISSAPEAYQSIIQQSLHGCPGVRNISDDIIVYGKNQAEHDQNLEAVLQRIKDKGLTLNKQKCLFGVSEITFFGFKISAAGVSPDDQKIDAIKNARCPTNPNEVRSFLGLVNYCARFFPNLATEAEPLRQLTRKGTEWEWTEKQEQAFQKLKHTLTSDCVMSHYDPTAPTELRVDASPVGLGAILTQTGPDGASRPIAYASRTLSDVERRYSQTEREALGVVWGCERFHLYLYGAEFSLYTDHKPLEVIYGPKAKPPARIERWGLRLQQYRFKVIYEPGSKNPADVLSRLPLSNQPRRERSVADEYINFVIKNAAPVAIPPDQIRRETANDPVLQQIQAFLHSGKWNRNPETTSYHSVRGELSVANGILLRGQRIVMPYTLRNQTLQLSHEGHQGIVKTKQLLREKVWWPGIDNQIEKLIQKCIPCQAQASPARREPLHMTQMPDKPWQTVYADLCGPFPSGESALVLIDGFSRWPEVEILKHSTTSETVIARLDKIFSIHGYPEELTTDNGTQFVSESMETYLKQKGIHHRKICPYWPRANGEVERFNRTLLKAIKAAHTERKDWRKELPQFLLNYRATPHTTTGKTPAKLLMGREIRTKVPQLITEVNTPEVSEARDRDLAQKAKYKEAGDQHDKACPATINIGDKVLLQKPRKNKLSTRFDPKPYTVKEKKGPTVILQRGSSQPIMRNTAFVRKLPTNTPPVTGEGDEDSDEDEEIPLLSNDPVQPQPVIPELVPGRPQRIRNRPQHLRDYVLN